MKKIVLAFLCSLFLSSMIYAGANKTVTVVVPLTYDAHVENQEKIKIFSIESGKDSSAKAEDLINSWLLKIEGKIDTQTLKVDVVKQNEYSILVIYHYRFSEWYVAQQKEALKKKPINQKKYYENRPAAGGMFE